MFVRGDLYGILHRPLSADDKKKKKQRWPSVPKILMCFSPTLNKTFTVHAAAKFKSPAQPCIGFVRNRTRRRIIGIKTVARVVSREPIKYYMGSLRFFYTYTDDGKTRPNGDVGNNVMRSAEDDSRRRRVN